MATVNRPLAGIRLDQPADFSNKDVVKNGSVQRRSRRSSESLTRELTETRMPELLLGGISNGAYYELKKASSPALDQDRLTRISLLTGIFKALNILYRKSLPIDGFGFQIRTQCLADSSRLPI